MAIPRLLHQTWKTGAIPDRFQKWSNSWGEHNPGWTQILWSDRMLLDFVAQHYPQLLSTYCAYPSGVQRADAARYMLLHHFGGVYADLDCECLASFDSLLTEDRIVLCKEPEPHAQDQIGFRNLPYLLFNGTIASPPGHPFWSHLLDQLPANKNAQEVLDSTGPCLLTAAQVSFHDQGAFAIHPNSLFSPLDRDGEGTVMTDGATPTFSVHHWAGTWWTRDRPPSVWSLIRREIYKGWHELTKGDQLDVALTQASVDKVALQAPPPTGDNIAILVPLRDAAEHIEPFVEALQRLEYNKERIKLVFCEGDSTDGSWDKLVAATAPLKREYRDVILLQKSLGTSIDRSKRWKPRLQRTRRAGIAAVRNHLIQHGLDGSDDWALWIDIDVWRYPADIINRLTTIGARIVVPNCTTLPSGRSFDLNSFVSLRERKDHRYYRSMRDGLYQPRVSDGRRLYLSDLRNVDRVRLDGVGGTMLLVDAALHRGGLTFPEIPYKFLIETEGFAALATDLGVVPIGLPKVEVLHVP